MDKLTMAHEYALEMAKQGIPLKSCKELGWKYADAMQAEAEEREDKKRPDVLNMANSPQLEWQPDWSQAPDDAYTWAINSRGVATWALYKNGNPYGCADAPSFDYQGNWQDSLRKRPHGK